MRLYFLRNIQVAFTIALMLIISDGCFGQAGDYLQYHLNAMSTNPGELGKDDFFQVITSIRKKSLTPDFGITTSSFSIVYPYYKSKHSLKRTGALGFNVFNENSGANNIFQMNGITLGLGHYLKTTAVTAFGFGIQIGYRQRKIDVSKITTDSQFSLDGFNPGLDTRENFRNNQSSALSISSGMTWYMKDEEGNSITEIGVAIFNLDRGSIPLISSDDPLIPKFITFGKYRLIHKNNTSILPNFRWIRQAKNDQFNFGLTLIKKRNEKTGEYHSHGHFGFSSWFNFEKTGAFAVEYFNSPYLIAMSYEIPFGESVVERAIGNAFELVFIWKIDRVMDIKIKRAKTSY